MSRLLLSLTIPACSRSFIVQLQRQPTLPKSTYQAKRPPRLQSTMTRFTSSNNQRTVIDRGFLHEDLATAAVNGCKNYTLVYDRSLRENHLSVSARSRGMFGRFHCLGCLQKGLSREWSSAVVCTEFLFVKPAGRSDKVVRYRCSIHSQKCRGCERYMEADLDRDQYVEKALRAFDLWTGNREAEDGDDQVLGPQKPHDRARCHGCQVGKCRLEHRKGGR